MNVLLVDNFDSFTYMLRDYVQQCRVNCDVIRNGESLSSLNVQQWDALIVSPGPETPEKSGMLLPFLKSSIANIPVLGICLGHQAIGQVFGSLLTHAAQPRHGKVDNIRHSGHPLFTGIPTPFAATRYHSLILKEIRSPLKAVAWSEQDEVMAVVHETLPVYGVQFHPESCQTPQGIKILENFLTLAQGKY
ncbi:MAG: aminodeoxychorismate/anthranilate synthase component II [Bacteroidia bacterium]